MKVLDKVTNSVFECTVIGDTAILEGINLKGTYRVPKQLLKSFSSPEVNKSYESQGWPERLADLVGSNVIKKRIVRINLSDVSKTEEVIEVLDIKKPKGRKPKKENLSDMYDLKDLSSQVQLDPRKLRALLRKNFTKPTEGWKWDKKDFNLIVQEVSKIIKG